MLADDCSINPDFCQYNRVFFAYCDGNSFASNLAEPLPVPNALDRHTGKPITPPPLIYFRGKQNMETILNTLVAKHGLGDAVNVLETGASAGGLAAYLHADSVHQFLLQAAPKMKRYKSGVAILPPT